MKLQEIYELGIAMAIEADPRGKEKVIKALTRVKKEYEGLSEKKRFFFDIEDLTNPYADSRVSCGDPKIEIKKVIAGIDASVAEVLLVDRLNQKGMNVDLLITHHPHGSGLPGLAEVMGMQAEYFSVLGGVPENVAYALVKERQDFIARRFKTIPNHGQTIDAAKLLNIPLLCLHTIWDNLGSKYMMDYISKKSFDTVGDLLEYILEIPEFHHAAKEKE